MLKLIRKFYPGVKLEHNQFAEAAKEGANLAQKCLAINNANTLLSNINTKLVLTPSPKKIPILNE